VTARRLTQSEVALAQRLFKASIDYEFVRIHDRGYTFIQRAQSGMTPNGQIYVTGRVHSDYARASPDAQSFFIHEMAHVWQKQCRILHPVWSAIGNSLRHAFVYERAYAYTLRADRDLLHYRMEQQAQIIEDYFRITALRLRPRRGRLRNRETDEMLRNLFHAVLSRFFEDPSYGRRR